MTSRGERDEHAGSGGPAQGLRRRLLSACHVAVALLLVAPLAAAAVHRDPMTLAISAIAAVLLVRILLINVMPRLERDDG